MVRFMQERGSLILFEDCSCHAKDSHVGVLQEEFAIKTIAVCSDSGNYCFLVSLSISHVINIYLVMYGDSADRKAVSSNWSMWHHSDFQVIETNFHGVCNSCMRNVLWLRNSSL